MKCQTLPARVENGWKSIKNGLLEAADEICGWTRGGCERHKETWQWNETVDNVVKVKRKAWKQQEKGGYKEEHLKAKRAAKPAVYFAQKDAQVEHFASINNNSDKNPIFKMTKMLKRDNIDVVVNNLFQKTKQNSL